MINVENETAMSMDISEIAYELYKQDWIDEHTSPQMRQDVLKAYYRYVQECVQEGFDIEPFDSWIWDCGYGEGMLYVCYDEFCDAEYTDEEYMCALLKDDDLIAAYREDIADEEDGDEE